MARPRKEKPPTRAVNLNVDQELDKQFENELRRRGIRFRQDAFEEAMALWARSLRRLLERFVQENPRESFGSKLDMADALARWINERIHIAQPQQTKIASADSTSKTSFNFPESLFAEFRETAQTSGVTQTNLAIEAMEDVIQKKKIHGQNALESRNTGVNNPSALKKNIDAIRRILDHMETMALLSTPGADHVVETPDHQSTGQSDGALVGGTVAGIEKPTRQCIESTDRTLARTDESLERGRENLNSAQSSLGDARGDLDDARRIVHREETTGGRESRTREKTG